MTPMPIHQGPEAGRSGPQMGAKVCQDPSEMGGITHTHCYCGQSTSDPDGPMRCCVCGRKKPTP